MLFKFIKMFYFFYHPAAKIGIYMGSARKNEQKKVCCGTQQTF